MHTMRHTPHWFHPRAAILVVLALAAVYVVWIGLRAQAQIPAVSAPAAVQAVAVTGPQASVRSATEYASQMARLRDLNTSGDPALDAGLLPLRAAGQQGGPY